MSGMTGMGKPNSVVDAMVQILEMDRSSVGDTEVWNQVRGIVTKAMIDTMEEEEKRAGDDALFDDAREALEIIVHDQAEDQFSNARQLIPRLRKRLGMPPIMNFDTPELAPLAPAAEVVALTKLENDNTSLTPRIVALRTDLPVGTKLYTEDTAAQSRSEQIRKQSVRFDLMGVVADVELGGGFGQLDPVCMGTLKRCIGLLAPAQALARPALFKLGDRVTKTSGSKWTGLIVGFYSTTLTPTGYAVESETETGSVQIYPEKALVAAPQPMDKP